MLTSALCNQAVLETPDFRRWTDELLQNYRMHRKLWEFGFICQALKERGFLKPGMRGIGFAVGIEPLGALFAKYGCEILGTDLPLDTTSGATASDWNSTGQHAASLEMMYRFPVCPEDEFRQRVRFDFVDMNHIPADLTGYDFCWSAGSVEHVGTMALSQAAIVNMTNCLRPGGLSVHVTEFNLLSNDKTRLDGAAVFYRHRDIEDTARLLRASGHRVLPVDGTVGDGEADHFIDELPYLHVPHMKLDFEGYTITSIGLIIEAGTVPKLERATPPKSVWVNDDFFKPAGEERRRTYGRRADTQQLRLRLARLTDLVEELRQSAAGPGHTTPAYRMSEVEEFRRLSRVAARATPLGDGTAIGHAFGDTHVYVDLADAAIAPAVLRDGAADLPGSVNLVRRVRPGETVLDIGAKAGYHTALFARLVSPGGEVIATESDLKQFALLKRTVQANAFDFVELHCCRVSSGTGVEERSVEELLRGRRLDYVRVGDPGQLAAAWDALAGAREANPELLALLTFHPDALTDPGAFLAQVRHDDYNLSLIASNGNVLPVPPWEGAFRAESAPWLLFAARA